MATIGIDLLGGQVRGRSPNAGTCAATVRPIRRSPSARALFMGAYDGIAGTCRAVEEPGLALLAVDEDTGRAAGIVCLRARVQRHVTAVIGRHDRCDLYLDGHAELALRQPVVIVDPVTSWRRGDASVRYRILDLRTETGFVDEDDRRLRGVRCEDAAIVRCGGYTIFALPLGDPSSWPDAARDAWAFLPERVYFDERFPKRRVTLVRTGGPRDQTETGGATLAGVLELGTTSISVSRAALEDGVILGRYARCNGSVDDLQISRVHALLIELGGSLVAIDLASTNGISAGDDQDRRVIVMDRELYVGDLRVRWAGQGVGA